ncbi:putative bifunctional diguanylate cyclase/phosphodiesterase [Sphingomonas bacterium]|uniref:putative bifunctional diguanylate cyclase/phosphodiesterase n=1 Tax=Sphingomonas bacterium TaxID=1895847 RepID=UPI0015768C54|nr:bifunctional diguanylate cyclase/phosphodiesterase [Sphingomonas bacterium]
MATARPLALTLTREVLEAGVELVPIPAAHITRHADGWAFEAFNRAYRLTGLGIVPHRSPMIESLRDRLDLFMAGTETSTGFDWSLGDAIDCRHYRVGVARLSALSKRRCTVTFVDVTQQLNIERSLRREMTTDSLTGLPNREGFGDLIEAATGAYAVLVINLDRFGQLNTALGSLAGDELLITVARRIKGALRARDSLARIGGDEFGVLVAIDDEPGEALALAERIHRTLRAPFRLTDYEIGVEGSIGIAPGEAAVEGEELIRHAQFANKRAKASGRTETYQDQAFTIARARFAMETELRCAIEERRLRLTFQPICDLATGRIMSVESLARWTDRQGRDHSPDQFIPVAEESGLIVPLGRWAIDEAARTLRDWDERAGGNGCGVRVAVNLSPIQLQRDRIASVLETALATTGLSGERFTLELTESAVIGDPDGVTGAMHALRDLGATLALDDFGTGYSNLAYLHKLPIDVLKIDRSFVAAMLDDRDKVAIVRAMVGLAQALGMQTTAEGVETAELARMLAALGCTYGQGWFYGRPLEADAAWALIASATAASASSSTLG